MSSEKIFKWNLSFVDNELEGSFKKSKIPYQKSLLKIVLLAGFMLPIFSWVLNPYNRPNYQGLVLILAIGIISLSIGSLILAIYREKFIENLILILVIAYIVSMLESGKKNNMAWECVSFFIVGAIIELLVVIPIFAKVGWFKNCCLFLLINFLWSFRYTPFESNYSSRFQPLVHFTTNFLILSITTYMNEKNDRQSFLAIKMSEKSLSSFKELIKEYFPNPVVITSGETLLFENCEAKNIFKEAPFGNPMDKFKEVIVEVSKEGEGGEQKEDKLFVDSLNLNVETSLLESPGGRSSKIKYSLFSIMSTIESKLPSLEKILFNMFTSIKTDSELKRFDMKVKRINWDGRKAFIFIFSENRIIDKLNFLQDQGRYKDKLLATISHDLRTPLNGILGMIDITLDMTGDQTLKK